MLISYSRPDPITWSLNGTGAAFLTDPIRLTNGRPTAATRMTFVSGTQTTSSVLNLRAAWAEFGYNDRVRLVGIVGTTLPVGLKIVASISTGFVWTNSPTEGIIVERADGVRVCWIRIPDTAWPGAGVQISIFNDYNGVAPLAPSEEFEIGEVWIGDSQSWTIRPTLQLGVRDFTKTKESIGGQPFRIPRRSARTALLEFTPTTVDQTFGMASVEALQDRLLGAAPCVVVPIDRRPFSGATSIDQDYLNANAMFGYATSLGPITGQPPRFTFAAQFQAPPVLLP
jgi:hypothetical protein